MMTIVANWLYIILLRTLLPLPLLFFRMYHLTPVLSIPGIIMLYRAVMVVAPKRVLTSM